MRALSGELLALLSRPSVHCANLQHVQTKIQNIVSHGPANLFVIADFDHTMSKHRDEKGRCKMVHEILEDQVSEDSAETKAKIAEIQAKYRPFASANPGLSEDERECKRQEWWWELYSAFVSDRFTRQEIDRLVQESRVSLREGCLETMSVLRGCGVPLLVMSAGVTDLIERFLHFRHDYHITPPDSIISNPLEFDTEGKLLGFRKPLIHCWNKKGVFVPDSARRSNVLVLGDSIGDAKMAEGIPTDNHLSIGFLNHSVEKNRSAFREGYDVVLEGDETWALHKAIIHEVCSTSHL